MNGNRKDCPMRHENGNCTVAGGFCTAVNDPVCEALHNAFNCGYRSALRAHQERESNDRLQSEMNRLGEFGKLFVEYKGCPRGAIGRACAPLEDEVFAMPEITDVDGGRWVPVNADALQELVNQYKRIMTREERNDPLTLDELRKMDGEDEK